MTIEETRKLKPFDRVVSKYGFSATILHNKPMRKKITYEFDQPDNLLQGVKREYRKTADYEKFSQLFEKA